MMTPLLECVPNFSEGTDPKVIEAIRSAIASVPGQKLLHIDPGPSANRTVFTFAGPPEAVVEAAFRAIQVATQLIDMRLQHGAHPRVGSTDVCPLVPLSGMTMQEAVAWSEKLAARVGAELKVPVYLYEYAARAAHRRALPDIRKGQYEGLKNKMQQPGWQPDYGPADWTLAARSGAAIIGARTILVAFNISLNTRDARVAAEIARLMRSSSQGLLPALRAIGWYMEDFDCAQVSMNLLDYRVTSPLKVWDTCRSLAAGYGLEPVGCEVVGLIPEACILEAGAAALGRSHTAEEREIFLNAGIAYLRLDQVKPFDPQEKVLEYALAREGLL
jgi:glutamate formiminotransferase/formiminotetrahydrofolate cyclodeaminase